MKGEMETRRVDPGGPSYIDRRISSSVPACRDRLVLFIIGTDAVALISSPVVVFVSRDRVVGVAPRGGRYPSYTFVANVTCGFLGDGVWKVG